MEIKVLKHKKKADGGVLYYEVTETVPEEKDFTKEVLKRVAAHMTIDISDLEPKPDVVEEPLK